MTKMSAGVRVGKQKYTKADAKEPEGYMSFFFCVDVGPPLPPGLLRSASLLSLEPML